MNPTRRARSYRSHINLAPMDFEVRQAFIKGALVFGEQARPAGVVTVEIILETVLEPQEEIMAFCDLDRVALWPVAACPPHAGFTVCVPCGSGFVGGNPPAKGGSSVNSASQSRVCGPAP